MDSHIESSEVTPKPLTPDELQAELKTLDESLDNLVGRDASFAEREDKRQQLLKEFIDKQIKGKDRYENIFRTEKGSIYFILVSGESLRVKQQEEGLKLQPLCRKVFYVDPQQDKELSEFSKKYNFQEEIIGTPIKTITCDVGATPIEFGITHMPEIKFTEEPGKITILGDILGDFASGYHRGHQITEIIK